MKKFLAIATFFAILLTIILGEQTLLFYFTRPLKNKDTPRDILLSAKSKTEIVTPLESYPIAADARPVLLAKYLRDYHSPLAPYAGYIWQVSQKLGIDYRLLVAIAQQESNLCKKAPKNSYNCWGWGIYHHKVTSFHSYPEAIETVAKGLKKDYLDKGLDTPEKIMPRYTPPSKGSWARGVRQFMKELSSGRW